MTVIMDFESTNEVLLRFKQAVFKIQAFEYAVLMFSISYSCLFKRRLLSNTL